MQIKAAYTPKELSRITGLSRHQIYRMRRRCRWGKLVYLRDLQAIEPLWESIILKEQLTG